MRILSQDREFITELGKETWITDNGVNGFLVIQSGSLHPYLGSYKDEQRAKEILRTIFDFDRSGKKTFIMPVE